MSWPLPCCANCPYRQPLPCRHPPTIHACRLDGYNGAIAIDDEEVAEVQWVQLAELRQHAEQHPEQYTQWFLDEVRSLGWFGAESLQQQPPSEAQPGRPLTEQRQLVGAG